MASLASMQICTPADSKMHCILSCGFWKSPPPSRRRRTTGSVTRGGGSLSTTQDGSSVADALDRQSLTPWIALTPSHSVATVAFFARPPVLRSASGLKHKCHTPHTHIAAARFRCVYHKKVTSRRASCRGSMFATLFLTESTSLTALVYPCRIEAHSLDASAIHDIAIPAINGRSLYLRAPLNRRHRVYHRRLRQKQTLSKIVVYVNYLHSLKNYLFSCIFEDLYVYNVK